MKKILNLILKPLVYLGIFPKLAPTGYLQQVNVFIGEKENNMTENEYLEMPWSIEETIENLKIIKEHLSATVLKTNLDGKGKQDAKEVEFDFNRAIQALEEIQQYRAIDTIEEFKALKEKNVAKKIRGTRFAEAICPKCESELFETYWAFGGIHYCSNCGQAIDWSEG